MNIFAWMGIIGAVLIILLPLLSKRKRTKAYVRETIIALMIVMVLVAMIIFFNMDPLLAGMLGIILFILCDKKTYTKKRFIIYTPIILMIGVVGFVIFRDNPDYIVNHLQKNPETTSFYLLENGVEQVTYQSDVVRPLASTVKILIAVEYAMQVDSGKLDQEELVSLDDLNQYYWENTDGGAHEGWLDEMNVEKKIENNEVKLHNVAKGMVKYSSNANTDYLMDVLGLSDINKRAESLGLNQHEKLYPIVSSQIIPEYLESEFENEETMLNYIGNLSMEDYRLLTKEINQNIQEGQIMLKDVNPNSSMDLQRIWSDRLIGSSANEYGNLLAIISNDELPGETGKIVRELLEWPMEVNPDNKNYYTHLGSKGGSTAFVLNDALYAETVDGDKLEMVLLTDDLNYFQSKLISRNLNSFEAKLLGSEDYRLEVQQELSNE